MTAPNVTLKVQHVEADVAWVYFEQPPANDYDRFPLLHRALVDWLTHQPRFVLTNIQSIVCNGRVVGLVASLTVKKTGPPTNWHVDIENELLTRHDKEYLEAVLAEGMQFIVDGGTPANKVVLVNRRGIAFFIDWPRQHAQLVPVERLWTVLPQTRKEQFESWLRSDAHGFWGMNLPDEFSLNQGS